MRAFTAAINLQYSWERNHLYKCIALKWIKKIYWKQSSAQYGPMLIKTTHSVRVSTSEFPTSLKILMLVNFPNAQQGWPKYYLPVKPGHCVGIAISTSSRKKTGSFQLPLSQIIEFFGQIFWNPKKFFSSVNQEPKKKI